MKKLFICLLATLTLLPLLGYADVEDLGDGTYKITGEFVFHADREMLVPAGKGNTYGEFKLVIFKPTVHDYPGIRELTTAAPVVFKVMGRPSTSGIDGAPILIVDQILEWEGGPQEAPGN